MHKLLFCFSLLSLNALHAIHRLALAQVSASEYCISVATLFNNQPIRTKKKVEKKDNQTCMQRFISVFTASNSKQGK